MTKYIYAWYMYLVVCCVIALYTANTQTPLKTRAATDTTCYCMTVVLVVYVFGVIMYEATFLLPLPLHFNMFCIYFLIRSCYQDSKL